MRKEPWAKLYLNQLPSTRELMSVSWHVDEYGALHIKHWWGDDKDEYNPETIAAGVWVSITTKR